MIKYRYLWLFVFGYAIGTENHGNNSKNLDIFSIAQQYTLRTMPKSVFKNVLDIFKEQGGYKESELAYYLENNSKLLNTQQESNKKSNTKKSNNKFFSDDQLLDQYIRENQFIHQHLKSKENFVLESEKETLEERLNYINSSYDFYKKNIDHQEFFSRKEFYLKTLLKIANAFKKTKAVTKKEKTKKKEIFALCKEIEQELVCVSKSTSLESVLSEVIKNIPLKNSGSRIIVISRNEK